MFKIESIQVKATIESPEWVIILEEWGWNISQYEEFFVSLRDDKHQTPATRKPCEAARMLLKWAGTRRAKLESFANSEPGLWVFNFGFDSTKDALEFLQYAEKYVNDTVNYI